MSRLMLFRLPSSVRSAGKEVFQRLTDLRKIVSLICTGTKPYVALLEIVRCS